MQPVNKPWWEQVTALVTLSVSGAITGFSFVPRSSAELKSPAGMPIHLMALERSAQVTPGDQAMLRAAILNVTNHFLHVAAGKTPAEMEALIWQHDSIDGVDHGESCAAFASLTLELAARAVGQQSWVTGGTSYPWPLHKWVDARVDPNPASIGITSILQDAQAHQRWHPLGDGYQPLPGDWVLFDGHVEVVTGYANGVLDTVGGDSLPNFSVNAHQYADPLAAQGVVGFVNNGALTGMAKTSPGSGVPVPGQPSVHTPADHRRHAPAGRGHQPAGGDAQFAGGAYPQAVIGRQGQPVPGAPGQPVPAAPGQQVPGTFGQQVRGASGQQRSGDRPPAGGLGPQAHPQDGQPRPMMAGRDQVARGAAVPAGSGGAASERQQVAPIMPAAPAAGSAPSGWVGAPGGGPVPGAPSIAVSGGQQQASHPSQGPRQHPALDRTASQVANANPPGHSGGAAAAGVRAGSAAMPPSSVAIPGVPTAPATPEHGPARGAAHAAADAQASAAYHPQAAPPQAAPTDSVPIPGVSAGGTPPEHGSARAAPHGAAQAQQPTAQHSQAAPQHAAPSGSIPIPGVPAAPARPAHGPHGAAPHHPRADPAINARHATGRPQSAEVPAAPAIPGLPASGTDSATPYRRHHAPAWGTPVNDSPAQQAFIAKLVPGAIAAQRRYGVPAAVTIAQAIDESGWGQSQLATADHNLFGIKGVGPAGSVMLPTQEYQNGQLVSGTSPFRVYHDIAGSIEDHGKLLATSPYYRQAMAERRDPNAFAAALTGIYATDPQYGAKLIELMRRYDLYRYDRIAPPPAAQRAGRGHGANAAAPRPAAPTAPRSSAPASPVPAGSVPAGSVPLRSAPASSTPPRTTPPTSAPPSSGPPGSVPQSSSPPRSAPPRPAPYPLRPAPGARVPSPSDHVPARPPTSAGAGPSRTVRPDAPHPAPDGAPIPGVPTPAAQPAGARPDAPGPWRTAQPGGQSHGHLDAALAVSTAATMAFVAAPAAMSRLTQRTPSRPGRSKGARYRAHMPGSVSTALITTAKMPLLRSEPLYRDIAKLSGIRWELLAACDWMQCRARPGYSPARGEKLGTLNPDGTIYHTRSEALEQCSYDLVELAASVYQIDASAPGPLSVGELASVFAAFRWGGLLLLHHTSAMEFPYSVAGLTVEHLSMRWPNIADPNTPDKPGGRFRKPFGAVPIVLTLNYEATV